ncbi:MAG: hypothetical protein ACFFG0_04070 [Candidatus Thorarchaeota archaeon]
MRIISKFHDYYDMVQLHGADPDLVFSRKKKEYKNSDKFDPKIEEYFRPFFSLIRGYKYYSPQVFAVIFCGKIYKGIKLYIKNETNQFVDNYDYIYCYNSKETIDLVKDKKTGVSLDDRKILIGGKYQHISVERKIEMFFDNKDSDKFMGLMIKKRCPILLIEKSSPYKSIKTTVNPILKDINFYRIIDPFTAYQNLSMFIGGILPRQSTPTVEISDEDMVIKKGFNKWSFRKMGKKSK